MQLDYLTLLSYEPFVTPSGIRIKSPKLRDISEIGFHKYTSYLYYLLLDVSTYFEMVDSFSFSKIYSEEFVEFLHNIKTKHINNEIVISILDIIKLDDMLGHDIIETLSFFTGSNIGKIDKQKGFLLYEDAENKNKVTGCIPFENYSEIINLILQRLGIQNNTMDKSKAKNKKAQEIIQKLNNVKEKNKNNSISDKRLEIPNIISAVSAYHKSINIVNIWDLTVYQLYDLFHRMQQLNIYDIQKLSVAAYGDSENKFDASRWFEYGKH